METVLDAVLPLESVMVAVYAMTPVTAKIGVVTLLDVDKVVDPCLMEYAFMVEEYAPEALLICNLHCDLS